MSKMPLIGNMEMPF